ncbi:M48 family metallopeptidase [Roseovarius aquimarinus]|uniref:M48 family metallopeptidase n=1 Tax=Roseovarius aquimarinus TaxID=1229156 RepID=A0ABW7I6H6_9RHOB
MLPVPARFYDGTSAARRDLRVMLSEDGRALTLLGGAGGGHEDWPLARLRALPGQRVSGQIVLTLHQPENTRDAMPLSPKRLVIRDAEMIAALKARCPRLMRRERRPRATARLVKRVGLAVAAVAVMLFVILPRMADTLAGLLPVEREIAFGRAVVGQIEMALGAADMGALDCEAPEGRAALERMTARLSEGADLAYELEVKVLDHEMVNAFAAPGGHVVLMRGLLDEASGPDAVAAVLAHEIGHVEARDATRLALRAAGSAGLLSMVMGDVTGGAAAVFLGEQVLQASYTREAEAAADLFALDLLDNAGVSSRGMAEFFDQIAAMESPVRDALPGYLASHPVSTERAERAERFAQSQGETTPILTDAEWRALRAICE